MNLDLVRLSAIVDKENLASLEPKLRNSPGDPVGDLSAGAEAFNMIHYQTHVQLLEFLRRSGGLVEQHLHARRCTNVLSQPF